MGNTIFDKGFEARPKRVWKLRQLTGLIIDEFATRLGLDAEIVRNWEKSYANISEKEAKALSDSLKKEGISCTEQWILEGLGSAPQIKMIF